MKSETERDFIDAFHENMTKSGFFHAWGGWNEGPGINYYDTQSVMDRKGPYLYRVLSWKSDLQLMLRVRNAEKCMEYLQGCPEAVKAVFRKSSPGCGKYNNGCNMGVRYIFEGEERWKCGCCNAPFVFRPVKEDIPHYIKLVQLGCKK